MRHYRIYDPHAADFVRHCGGQNLFAAGNEQDMYRTANELNSESLTGWHSLVLTDNSIIYMYRQCLWTTASLDPDSLTEVLCDCITEYKYGREHLVQRNLT